MHAAVLSLPSITSLDNRAVLDIMHIPDVMHHYLACIIHYVGQTRSLHIYITHLSTY